MAKAHNLGVGVVAVLSLGALVSVLSQYPVDTLPKSYALDERVTQENIQKTICVKGYSAKVRPGESYTKSVRKHLHANKDQVLDHAVSIELGGKPQDLNNLWLEPKHLVSNGTDYGSLSKDRVENYLHKQVCEGKITLAEAQRDIILNWPKIFLSIKGNLGGLNITSDD